MEDTRQTDTTTLRLQLVRAGYTPIPLHGKIPPSKQWQQTDKVTPEMLAMWAKTWPDAQNTGVLTRSMPTLDTDLLSEEAARAVESHVREFYEERGYILVRIGRAPKRAIPFRTEEPFAKIVVNLIAPSGTAEKIEFLGDGQQVVIDGIHPDTKQPYRWHGGEPGQIKLEELPYIRGEEAHRLVDEIIDLLVSEFGYRRTAERPRKRREGNGGSRGGPIIERGSDDWQYLFDNILAGRELHDSLRDVSAKMIRSGMSAGATVNALRALMQSSTAPHDGRWEERYEDIVRMVAGAEDLREAHKEEAEAGGDAEELPPLLHAYAPRSFSQIPRRQWLHAGHYIRQQVVMTVAPGGYGKTTLLITNAVEMCTGLGLLGSAPPGGAMRVAYWNAEDPEDEVERRVAATCLRHNIDPEALRGRLFLGSKITGRRCL